MHTAVVASVAMTARDDGYASETAALKLDADWVVLSACNTAGGSGESAEALSGLARAFFYAGARALLVSHWEVGSAAAVKLTTAAFAELKQNPALGRAEAFRRSMRALVASGSLAEAHPAMWAPFAVVGEGGAPAAALTTQAISPEPPTAAKDDATPAPSKTKRFDEAVGAQGRRLEGHDLAGRIELRRVQFPPLIRRLEQFVVARRAVPAARVPMRGLAGELGTGTSLA